MANIVGQPIRLTIMPSGPAHRGRNAFDSAIKPGSGRSLAERVTRPRSASPARDADEGPSRGRGDRYVPGRNDSRSRSPPRRREGGRRPGDRRPAGRGQRGAGPRGGRDGREGRDGRPRKTQDELDAEMADYFGGKAAAAAEPASTSTAAAGGHNDDDIDMI